MAAFTFATDDRAMRTERLMAKSKDVVQLIGLYFHTHLAARLAAKSDQFDAEGVLTQRERQCLAWASRGKTVADTAILVAIAPRTVVFHLENARRKMGAASITQCVAESTAPSAVALNGVIAETVWVRASRLFGSRQVTVLR